jgi:16S rRNA (guanine527-N7)-methyltransferase
MKKEYIHNFFIEQLSVRGILINDVQLSQFETYFNELVLWNEKINLTAITDKNEVYIKHFFDSISCTFFCDMSGINSLVDIGSGAGFPGIPLKILYPSLSVTIIDSLNKRIQFVQHLTNKLSLSNVNCIHGRAEDIARDKLYRARFDIATARAVAKLSILNELCLPFVKKTGFFLVMKGPDIHDEISGSTFSLNELNATIADIFRLELPIDSAIRHIIKINKFGETSNKYPRRPGLPSKSPLI